MQYFKKESSVCVCVCVCARARALSSVWLFVAPWTAVCQAPLPTRHGIFKDHVKLCLSTTNTNAKKQTELLSCVETFCNNGEVCVSVCVRARVCWGRGAEVQLAKLQKSHGVYRVGRTWTFHPHRDTAWYPGGELAREPRSGAAGGKEPAQRLKTQAASIRPVRTLQELQGSQQETARYGLTWVSSSLEKSLPQRAMNRAWSQRVRGEEHREFSFRVWGIQRKETLF